ncbi:MAG: GAF domain-containing protein [Anaerolineae bacterium]|nr:MAG: GAF domain-containing protein [Anaerolineae bacterium]
MTKTDLILLALDETATLTLMERALRAAGYETAVAHEEASLQKALQESSPALVLVGERLDGKDGLQLADALLERFPTLPIVLFSERDRPELAREALRIGISGYLHPPLRMQDIVAAIRQSLERARRLGDWLRREVKRTTASLERRVNELETLLRLGRQITASLDLETVLKSVVVAAVDLTGAEEGGLLMLSEDGRELYLRAGHNFEAGEGGDFRLPVQGSLAGQVVESKEPLVLNSPDPQKIKTAYLVHALIYVPLRLKERVIGVLGVDNRVQRRPFTQHHALLMAVLADYAAIAIENARLYRLSEAERAKLETTFGNIEDGVMLLDTENRILLINDAMRRAFNLNQSNLIGQHVLNVITHDDLVSMLERSEKDALKYHEIHFEDGQVFNAQYTPIPGVGAAITMQDITYLKELDRIKNDFVHTVSHDLRSPLTAVLGYTELLERVGPLNEQQMTFVRRIQSSIQAITALVDDLLDLGRIEAGFDTRREIVHLEGILHYTLDNLQLQIEQKGIRVHSEVEADLPPVRGNPIRLRQMLDNLIGNAIKYTPEGGDIWVDMNVRDQQVIIRVRDSGPGIPPEDQPHIFDKFYRASNVPPGVSGSGLGLAIVKSIVESHQGRVWVESTLGEGSTFIVVLPSYDVETLPSPP